MEKTIDTSVDNGNLDFSRERLVLGRRRIGLVSAVQLDEHHETTRTF
jgi:hypothetical protein